MFDRFSANTHAKRYIEEVFADRLKQEGFACPDNRLLCWYRITNDTVVNSIVFCSTWSALPLMLSVGYGLHPLFNKPAYTSSVNYPHKHSNSELLRKQPLVESGSINNMQYSLFSNDVRVMVPAHGSKGLYTFEGVILPKMEQATSIEACYQIHKNIRLKYHYDDEQTKFASISDVFVDEAIYVGDTEVYPYCIQSAERKIEILTDQCSARFGINAPQEALKEWKLRQAVLLDNSRDEYIRVLEKRLEANRKQLINSLGTVDGSLF